MENLFFLTQKLCACPSVSGYEHLSANDIVTAVQDYSGGFFDSFEVSPAGSVFMTHSCGNQNAPTLLLDAHIDTIGFAVTEHVGNGFVKVCAVGGIDSNILPSLEVVLHGKSKDYRGFFTSVPPHLASKDTKSASPVISELSVDTGLDDEVLKNQLPIGTSVSFYSKARRLMNNRICSAYLDDKICISVAAEFARLACEKLQNRNINICVLLSCGEEKNMLGAATASYFTDISACIVLDVNFAKEKSSKEGEFIPMDSGAGISFSSCTDRSFIEFICNTAAKNSIKHSRIVEMTSTGTNAQVIARTSHGIPTAVVSIPLKYMHTSAEMASLCDVKDCAELLLCVANEFNDGTICKPVYFVKGGKILENK